MQTQRAPEQHTLHLSDQDCPVLQAGGQDELSKEVPAATDCSNRLRQRPPKMTNNPAKPIDRRSVGQEISDRRRVYCRCGRNKSARTLHATCQTELRRHTLITSQARTYFCHAENIIVLVRSVADCAGTLIAAFDTWNITFDIKIEQEKNSSMV